AVALALVLARERVLGPRVGGTLLVLGLPVIAHFLEAVLERRVGDAMGPLALAILLDRGVMGLREGPLRLGRRTLDGVGKLRLLGCACTCCLWHRVGDYPCKQGEKRIESGRS